MRGGRAESGGCCAAEGGEGLKGEVRGQRALEDRLPLEAVPRGLANLTAEPCDCHVIRPGKERQGPGSP